MYKKNYAKIPKELKQIDSWVLWKYFTKEDGKITKQPKGLGGYNVSVTDPKNFISFEDTVMALHSRKDEFDGIGFCFTKNNPYFGIDLDHCFTDGELNEYSKDKFKELNTYTEISPSGEGIHLIGKLDNFSLPKGSKNGEIEFYTDNRFFTFTGNVVEGYETIREMKEAMDLHDKYFPQEIKEKPNIVYKPTTIDEQKVIQRLTSSNHEYILKMKNLYYNGYEGSTYSSHSEADLALIGGLVLLCDGDGVTADSLFRKSALMRPKWDRVGKDALKKVMDSYIPSAYDPMKPIPITFEENEEKQKEAEENKIIYKDYVIPTIPKHYWTGSFKEVSEATGVKDWATMIGSLSAFGAIAAKDVVISESIGFQYTTSLYILSAAPSGSGKSMIVKVCSDIIKSVSELLSLECNVKHISLLSGIESGQALQESFIQTVAGKDEKGKEKQVPSRTAKEVMVINEEFQQVCFVMMRSGGTLETVMNDLYMKCGSYSIEKMALKRDFGATGGRIVLDRPIVSVLGTMVTSQFSLTFDNDTKRTSGMFNRFLVLPCEKKKFDDGFGSEGGSLYDIDALKESAHGFLDKVNKCGYNFTNKQSGVVFGNDAKIEYNKGGFLEEIWDGLDESNRRTGMHVKSLSVIFAIADGRGMVNAFDVERALFITKMSIETKARLFEEGREAVTVSVYDQADHAIEMNILRKIKESGGRINKRDLGFSLKSRKLSSKKIGDVISNMEREGEIILESVDNYDEEGKKVRPSLWVSINKKDA